MTTLRCSALLFDLDGVLIDSTPAVTRVWTRWALAHGFDPAEIVYAAHGRPSRSTIAQFLPNSDVDKEDRLVESMEIEDLHGVVPLPGAMQLLNSLPPRHWTIATSCTRPLAEVRIRAAGLPVPRKLITSTDVKNGKPSPEPYLKAAASLNVESSDCIVVEDVPAGIRAGKAAGARVIAFPTTVDRSHLESAGADWIVQDCSELTAKVQQGHLLLTLPL